MSKFHLLNIVSFILLLVILITGNRLLVSLVFLALAYMSILALGSIFIQFNFYFRSLNRAPTTQKIIALTFDDGPDPAISPIILELLAKYNAKATFFCVGKKIADNINLLQKIDESGHLIGNHSFSHSNYFSLSSSKKIKLELDKTTELITKSIGKKPRLFRPPFGVSNPSIATALKKTGLVSVGWSLRSLDTVSSSEKVLRKLKRKLKSGDVILFHDNRKNTPEILEVFLPWLNETHFKVVGLDELFNIEAYEKI